MQQNADPAYSKGLFELIQAQCPLEAPSFLALTAAKLKKASASPRGSLAGNDSGSAAVSNKYGKQPSSASRSSPVKDLTTAATQVGDWLCAQNDQRCIKL